MELIPVTNNNLYCSIGQVVQRSLNGELIGLVPAREPGLAEDLGIVLLPPIADGGIWVRLAIDILRCNVSVEEK